VGLIDRDAPADAGALRLGAPAGMPFAFAVEVGGAEDGASPITVTGPDASGARAAESFQLRERTHNGWLDLFAAVAARFGTRVPRNRRPAEIWDFRAPYRALLTENLAPGVLHGYGDPAVIRVEEGGEGWYYLVVTSNDAPGAFPIARSRDLSDWEPRGFVFPAGRKPAWAAEGEGASDFWAPEMHRVGGE
jgi:arabinan endo-1,5-alpha-L-arabinosidase